MPITLLREIKPEGYNTLSDHCPGRAERPLTCLSLPQPSSPFSTALCGVCRSQSPVPASALPLEGGVPADPHGGSSYICSAEAHPHSTNKQGHMFIPHSIPYTINIYFQ